jgi:hypothetical protein
MLGQSIIVLNSAQAASDLFEKKSAKYSDRTNAHMARDPNLLVSIRTAMTHQSTNRYFLELGLIGRDIHRLWGTTICGDPIDECLTIGSMHALPRSSTNYKNNIRAY